MGRTLDVDAIVATRPEVDDETKAAINNLEVAADAYDRLTDHQQRAHERFEVAAEVVPTEVVVDDVVEEPVIEPKKARKPKT
jgi:hypothetical protein